MTRDHDEVQVGGELDEARLRAIMVRGFRLRNLCVSGDEVFTYKAPTHDHASDGSGTTPWSEYGGTQHTDGETPWIVHGVKNYEGAPDPATETYELHMGCGDVCGVFASIPYDPDMGRAPEENAEAIAHAGRDLIDLVREVVALRAEREALRIAHTELLAAANAALDEHDAGRLSADGVGTLDIIESLHERVVLCGAR